MGSFVEIEFLDYNEDGDLEKKKVEVFKKKLKKGEIILNKDSEDYRINNDLYPRSLIVF